MHEPTPTAMMQIIITATPTSTIARIGVVVGGVVMGGGGGGSPKVKAYLS